MTFATKRIYALPLESDGYRVLVDRLWPRGLSRQIASVELWLRDVAPSTELRKWYGHVVERWPEFADRYRQELEGHGALLNMLLDIERHHGTVTLLFAARDEAHNEAVVLADVLRRRPAHSTANGSRFTVSSRAFPLPFSGAAYVGSNAGLRSPRAHQEKDFVPCKTSPPRRSRRPAPGR